MGLENIGKREDLFKEAIIQWKNELDKTCEDYLKLNEIAMDAKMYFSLNQLYLKMKRDKIN